MKTEGENVIIKFRSLLLIVIAVTFFAFLVGTLTAEWAHHALGGCQ